MLSPSARMRTIIYPRSIGEKLVVMLDFIYLVHSLMILLEDLFYVPDEQTMTTTRLASLLNFSVGVP